MKWRFGVVPNGVPRVTTIVFHFYDEDVTICVSAVSDEQINRYELIDLVGSFMEYADYDSTDYKGIVTEIMSNFNETVKYFDICERDLPSSNGLVLIEI